MSSGKKQRARLSFQDPDDELAIPDFLLRDTPEKEERARQAWRNYDMAKKAKEEAEQAAADKAKPKTKTPAKGTGKADAKADAKTEKTDKTKVDKTKDKSAAKGEKDEFGFRKGSLKSRAAALYARKDGATREEVVAELQSSQLNLLKELEEAGQFVVTKKKEEGSKGKKPVTRYWLKKKK